MKPLAAWLALADAVLIAAATREARVATADPDVLAVANSEGTVCVTLPGQG
jgi:hypothetical protein